MCSRTRAFSLSSAEFAHAAMIFQTRSRSSLESPGRQLTRSQIIASV